MTHHIFFPQKVVVLRKTSILLWKKMTFFEKLPQLYSYEKICLVRVPMKNFLDLLFGLKVGLVI